MLKGENHARIHAYFGDIRAFFFASFLRWFLAAPLMEHTFQYEEKNAHEGQKSTSDVKYDTLIFFISFT